MLVSVDSGKGSRTIAVKPVNVKGMTMQLNCQGEGTISIAIEPISEEQEGPCMANDVNFMSETGHDPEERTIRSVVVKAPPNVRWTLTIGRYWP
ncbi:hypothetical protein [Streptomyces sp. NPDC057301]|uniref:hypothetical protein n=1 Tax=Streptomyces sp. NPDC057301 TaxID=3346093 RepID=UPI00363C3B7F